MRPNIMSLTPPISPQDHARGDLSAPVVLVHLGDFECPYSGALFPTLQKAKTQMGDDLCVVFRAFPLPDLHPHAMQAALAAEAAGDKFWQMHDLLFQNQGALELEDLRAYAAQIGLDDNWETRMNSDAIRAKVESSIESGHQSGAHGTPSVWINGVFHDNDEGIWRASRLMPLLEAAKQQ